MNKRVYKAQIEITFTDGITKEFPWSYESAEELDELLLTLRHIPVIESVIWIPLPAVMVADDPRFEHILSK